MLKYLFPIALIATPAAAGTLQWNVTTGSDTCPTATAPSGGTMNSICASVSDTDIGRIIADYQTLSGYDKVPELDASGKPVLDKNGQPVTVATTPQQVIQLIVQNTLTGILNNAASVEKAKAVSAASAGVAPIVATPQ